jgi:hypothetical protein
MDSSNLPFFEEMSLAVVLMLCIDPCQREEELLLEFDVSLVGLEVEIDLSLDRVVFQLEKSFLFEV